MLSLVGTSESLRRRVFFRVDIGLSSRVSYDESSLIKGASPKGDGLEND